MGICFNHIYFRPKISAACFKISFSILNCWFSFRSRISSSCSGVRLSFSWKEPELDACFTHLSNREVAMSYSRQISHLRLPERYSSTSCCLNSSVYLRGFRRCFCSVIKSAPSCIYYRLYDLKKSVQLIVTYPCWDNIHVHPPARLRLPVRTSCNVDVGTHQAPPLHSPCPCLSDRHNYVG